MIDSGEVPRSLTSFPGGRLTCGDRLEGLSSWAFVFPVVSATDRVFLIVRGLSAGREGLTLTRLFHLLRLAVLS
jgi:hypothetical protein